MAISQVSDLNSLFPGLYEESVHTLRESNLMVGMVTQFNGEGYAARTVPLFSQSSVSEVAEGVDYSNPTTLSKSTKATFTPKEAMSQYLITDRMVETDSLDNINEAARMELGMGIAEKIDTDLLALFDDFDTTKGTAGSAMTIAYCAAALAVIRNSKARGERMVVWHPYHWHDVWTELGQPTANQAFLGDTANEAMRDYAVGRFLAASHFVSANISEDASDDAYSGAFTRDAMVYDQRSAYRIEPERDASLRAWELNAHVGYAVGTFWADHGVGLLGDAAEPTGA